MLKQGLTLDFPGRVGSLLGSQAWVLKQGLTLDFPGRVSAIGFLP